MSRTRVKICGITRIEDALAAAKMGVDAVGLVFYPASSRNVSVTTAKEIVAALPAFVTTVALFVDESRQKVEQVIHEVAIDMLQFHGDESPEFCAGFDRPYIKALRVRTGIDLQRCLERHWQARAVLLDAWHPTARGGTGQSFDWTVIPHGLAKPLILAGGLSPGNVRKAIEQVRPYAVDVSSGVESEPGIKDFKKMAFFFEEVSHGDRTKAI